MINFTENIPTIHGNLAQQSSESEISQFRRRTLTDREWTCSRRYVLTLLLAVLLVIEEARVWSITYSVRYASSGKSEKMIADVPWEIWTETLKDFRYSFLAGSILINFLGGVLIYCFSSHKFLLVTVTAFSILHALIPTALKHPSKVFILTVIIGQEALAAPIRVAVLSMWKDWAPPDERTRLVTISFLGIGVEAISTLILIAVSTNTFANISYCVGFAGIVWALFWYNITSATPQSDPLITEEEYLYLKSKIPSHYQEKTRLKDVPWKCMFKSKQFLSVNFIFLTLGTSVGAIRNNELLIHIAHDGKILIVFELFMAFYIFVFIGSSFLMDFVLKKHRSNAVTIRKIFLCLGFVLHGATLLGGLKVISTYYIAIVYTISYCCFAFSIPGILRYPMDLSPRYVSIISGFAFGCYNLGRLTYLHYKPTSLFDPRNSEKQYSMFIAESVISFIAALIFVKWGDTKEQSWSFLKTSQRRGNDYRELLSPRT